MSIPATTTTKSMSAFILASSSPRRRELLASLGIDFEIRKPDVDETQQPGESPETYVQRLSREKAAAVARQLEPPALVLAADTIVIHQGVILGKPIDDADARLILRQLRARTHRVCTAITLHRVANSTQPITRLDCTEVTMRAYTDDDIETYIASGDPFDKAGAYAIQHPDFAPVAHIEGSYSNVMGLPLELLQAALEEIGWALQARS
jgi:septum formation protein